jgi:phage/plasmid-like protein (TIGR03299 family)
MGEILLPGDSLEERLRKGGLDWHVLRVPSQYVYNGELKTAPNSFHMIRSDNGASLAVNSRLYQAHQPKEVVSIFDRFVEVDERWRVETLGSLKGGKVIWGLARFVEDINVAGDAHAVYAMLNTSFDGSLATRMCATAIRAVCNNTLSAGMWRAEREGAYISVRHNLDFSRPDVRADALDRFAAVIAEIQQYKAMGEALAAHRMAAHQIEGLFKRLTIDKAANGDAAKEEAPTGRARAALERLLSSYRDTLAEGTQGGTAWAALNGVTRYVDHNRTVRDTEGDGKEGARFASSLLGSGASLKREAVGVLAELAGFALAA